MIENMNFIHFNGEIKKINEEKIIVDKLNLCIISREKNASKNSDLAFLYQKSR